MALRRARRGEPARSAAPAPAPISFVPYIAVVVGYGSLFLAALDRRTSSLGGIVVGAIALTATVLVRQVVAVRDNVRLSAESAARQSEARFRSLVQNSSDIIAVIGLDTTIRYQSPSVERVLGYRPEELAGTKLVALVHPDDVPRALALVAETAARAGLLGAGRVAPEAARRSDVLRRGHRHQPPRGPDDRGARR